jgi:AsmA family protein
MYLDPFALFLGEARVGRVLLEGADIVIERNEAGDTNLEMLPPPDGSGPHAGENRSFRLRGDPAFPWIGTVEVRDSTLTVSEGAGRPAVVLNVARGTFKSAAANQPLQMDASLGVPQAPPMELTGTIGSFDGWMRGLPGNIDVQGGYGGGKIAIKGSIGTKGTALQVTSEGPDFAVFGPYVRLPLPSGGPYTLNAKVGTQRTALKVEVPSLKIGASELSGEALFRADRSGTPVASMNIDAVKIDLGGLRAAPAPAANPSAPQGQRRFLPGTQLQASWLGREAISVTARVGEMTGLSGKITNGSLTLTSSEKRFAFRGAASVGGGSVGFDLVYDPTGRAGQTTLTATASKVSMADLGALLGLDLGLKDAVGDLDLRLRGGGRNAGGALTSASGVIEFGAGKGTWPADGLAGWPAESMRLLNAGDSGAGFNCLAGRFEVSGGVAYLRRLVVDTPRATWVGGGYVSLRNEGWEFIVAPEARDGPGVQLASPLRIKGGTGRPASGALEPGLGKLLIGGGVVPSLTATLNQSARQPNVNACVAMAPRVDGMRPGLRAQLPTPTGDRERSNRRPQGQTHAPRRHAE